MTSHKSSPTPLRTEILVSICALLLLTSIALVIFIPKSHSGPHSSFKRGQLDALREGITSRLWSGAPSAMAQQWIVDRPRFILFGDSLTERSLDVGGWGASLAHTYFRRVDVVNRGYGGYNTKWALLLVDEIFKGATASNTALVTIFFGANDAAIPMPDGTPHSARQHIPLSEYRDNLKEIVAALRAKGLNRIVLLTPPPVYEPGRKESQKEKMGAEAEGMPLDRTNTFTKQYALGCQEVAKELGLPVVDLWTSMQEDKDWGTRLFNDGLHFTIDGQQHVYQLVQKAINESFPDIRFEALPLQFPAWDTIDPINPAATLTKPDK